MASKVAELEEAADLAGERLEAGDAGGALQIARDASRRAGADAPPDLLADLSLLQGLALVDLCCFAEARPLLEALAEEYEDAWAEEALAVLARRRGDRREAERHFARARKLAPDDFPRPVLLSSKAFDAAVEDALAELPDPVRRYLENVAIAVEDIPADDDLLGSDPPHPPSILGIFRGSPLGEKASMDPWSHFPSSIVLYQENLQRYARTREELVEEITITLQHEVGHFLGLGEEELEKLGLD
ncbi:MAG TPA: metallopeptidase family protein [Anaeromyxobacteraceae bacterium]